MRHGTEALIPPTMPERSAAPNDPIDLMTCTHFARILPDDRWFLCVRARRGLESFDDRFCRRRNAKAIFPPNPTIIGVASVL